MPRMPNLPHARNFDLQRRAWPPPQGNPCRRPWRVPVGLDSVHGYGGYGDAFGRREPSLQSSPEHVNPEFENQMGLFELRQSTALLAMDLQRDFLQPDGRLTISQGQISGLIEAMNRAIDRGARTGLAVIYTFNAYDLLDPSNLLRNFAAIKGTQGSLLDPRILQVSPSTVLIKRVPDAFSNPRLATLLADRRVKRLIIGGVYADACVTATTRTALARGLDVTLLRDGVGAANDSARDRACADLVRRGAKLATVQSALG